MLILNVVIGASITIFSLGLLLISLLSYRRYKNIKLFFVSLVFIIFLIKGILLTLNLFYENLIGLNYDPYLGVLDLIMLLLLFMATLKRQKYE